MCTLMDISRGSANEHGAANTVHSGSTIGRYSSTLHHSWIPASGSAEAKSESALVRRTFSGQYMIDLDALPLNEHFLSNLPKSLLERRTAAKTEESPTISNQALQDSFSRVQRIAARENYQRFYYLTRHELWIQEQFRSRHQDKWSVHNLCEELTKGVSIPPGQGLLVQAFSNLGPSSLQPLSQSPYAVVQSFSSNSYRSSGNVLAKWARTTPSLEHLRDLKVWDFCVALRQGRRYYGLEPHVDRHQQDDSEITPVIKKSWPRKDRKRRQLEMAALRQQKEQEADIWDKCITCFGNMHQCMTKCFKTSGWDLADRSVTAMALGTKLATLCCGCPAADMVLGEIPAGNRVAVSLRKVGTERKVRSAESEQQRKDQELQSSSKMLIEPPKQQIMGGVR